MVWIRTTLPDDAHGALATSYKKLGAPPARLDQIILAHSERPHTLDGHMALYRAGLHHSANTLEYVNRLARTPTDLSSEDIEQLRAAGWDDGQILEINQVAAYFAYANRTVLGLGVTTDNE